MVPFSSEEFLGDIVNVFLRGDVCRDLLGVCNPFFALGDFGD